MNANDESFSTTFSISEPSLKNDLAQTNGDLKIEENNKDYPIRCPDCYSMAQIYLNLNTNNYCTMCDNKHKNVYNSFEELIENCDKKLSSILCYQCKNESDLMYRCNDNNFFFCQNCKENSHSKNFTEIKQIDITCPKHHKNYKYYDTKNNKHICDKCYYDLKEDLISLETITNYRDTVDKFSKKAIENIKMWNNVSRIINNWLKTLNDKFNAFLSSIGNYCLLQQKIVNYVTTQINYEGAINNFNLFSNYEAINNEKADTFIRNINEYLNFRYNKKLDFCTTSKYLIDILDDFNKTEIIIESKTNIKNEEKEKINMRQTQLNKELKLIKDMCKKKFELDSRINCLTPFDEDNYLLIGLNTGEIKICEAKEEELIENLVIKEFNFEISHICEIDKDLFVATDVKSNLKII